MCFRGNSEGRGEVGRPAGDSVLQRGQTFGEPGLAGWTIFLDADNNGVLDDGEAQTTTDADGNYAWYVMALGYPVLGIWYWCSDQTIVQRVLGARDEQHARVGPLFALLLIVVWTAALIEMLPSVTFRSTDGISAARG